jgi:hypothetical protein
VRGNRRRGSALRAAFHGSARLRLGAFQLWRLYRATPGWPG